MGTKFRQVPQLYVSYLRGSRGLAPGRGWPAAGPLAGVRGRQPPQCMGFSYILTQNLAPPDHRFMYMYTRYLQILRSISMHISRQQTRTAMPAPLRPPQFEQQAAVEQAAANAEFSDLHYILNRHTVFLYKFGI